MRYRIPKGEHSTFRFPRFYNGQYDGLEGNFTFLEGCWYARPDEHVDWMDVNKLTGVSFGFHQRDSLRIGWRPNFEEEGHIEVFAYWYNHRKFTFESIGIISTQSTLSFQILFFPQQSEALFQIESLEPKKIPMEFPTVNWGYLLFPYFGGDMTAPQDIEMDLVMELKKMTGRGN